MKQKPIKQLLIKLVFVALCTGCTSNISNAQAFIRIYNDQGKKIGKGDIKSITDSVLIVENEVGLQGFFVTEISFIKTGRSLGASIGLGASLGILPILLLKNPDFDEDQWKTFGIVIASTIAAGTVVGFVTGVTTKQEKFLINGDIEKWKTVKDQLLELAKKDEMPG